MLTDDDVGEAVPVQVADSDSGWIILISDGLGLIAGRSDVLELHPAHVDEDRSRSGQVGQHVVVEVTGSGAEFEWGTESAVLTPLPTVAPHFDVADVDNDGWPDIVTSASAEDGTAPAIYRNTGSGQLSFEVSAGLGSDQYWIGGPMTDIDHDGRLDLFAVEWEPSLPSIMFRNTGDTGHWLEVSIGLPGDGIGSLIGVSTTDGSVVGQLEIGVGGGYSSGRLPVAHFGLGDETVVDLTITLPDGTGTSLPGVTADQHLRWPNGC